eukprot:2272711-Prymnesium_polylepis.1
MAGRIRSHLVALYCVDSRQAEKLLTTPADGQSVHVDLDEARCTREDPTYAEVSGIANGNGCYCCWDPSWRRKVAHRSELEDGHGSAR